MKGKAIVEQIRKDNIVRTDGLVTASIRAHVLRRLSEEKKRLVAEHFALLEDDDDFDDEDDFDDSDFDNGEDEEDFDDDEDDEDLVDEGLKPTDPSRKTRKAHDKKVQRAAGKKIKEEEEWTSSSLSRWANETESNLRKKRDERINAAKGNIYLKPKQKKAEIDGANERYKVSVDLMKSAQAEKARRERAK
jgi:hypothetical protein